jgi:VIT1/CCC1 family predicted Fe2+/Mn2+ transporter
MGVGNYLAIRSHESARRAQWLAEEEAAPSRHGIATFAAFASAGVIPLLAYLLPSMGVDRFVVSTALTVATLFVVGASRSLVMVERWWTAGSEMLGLGVVVAAVAYLSGWGVRVAIGG